MCYGEILVELVEVVGGKWIQCVVIVFGINGWRVEFIGCVCIQDINIIVDIDVKFCRYFIVNEFGFVDIVVEEDIGQVAGQIKYYYFECVKVQVVGRVVVVGIGVVMDLDIFWVGVKVRLNCVVGIVCGVQVGDDDIGCVVV